MRHIGAGIVSADKTTSGVPSEAIESFARCILPTIRAYFESDEGQRYYAEWLAEKKKTDAAKAELQ